MKLIGRFLLLLGAIGLLVCGGLLAWFAAWRNDRLEELRAGSELAEVAGAVVEYAAAGENGPPVLVFHGAPGGYDQALALGAPLSDAGFQVLAPSRPGYLRTPLGSGLLLREQVDLLAGLLDDLGYSDVGVLGFGEGAAYAVEFCLRYPERVRAAAFLSPVVLRADERSWARDLLPGERLHARLTGDIGSWFLARTVRRDPARVFRWMLEAETRLNPTELAIQEKFVGGDAWQRAWCEAFFLSLTPLGPREAGLRNDITQLAALRKFDFSTLAPPVLVVTGAADDATPADDAKALAEQIPDCTKLRVADAGMLVYLGSNAPEAVEELVEFFRSHLTDQD